MFSQSPNLFAGTAEYYAKYRPGYPKEFFTYFVESFSLSGKERLLDLGCGTGQIAIPFSPYVAEVVGVDPEQEMLDQAAREAEKAGIKNIRFVLGKAEEISETLGTFTLTTMGASFHWMNQREVLQRIYNCTEKDGGVVTVSDSSSPWRDAHAERWKEARKEVIERYLGEKRRAGDSFYTEPKERFEDLLNQSPFGGYTKWTHDYTRVWNLESVVGLLYSTSFASKRLFGDKLDEFENDLKKVLLEISPEGVYTEMVRLEALIARK